MRDIPNELAGRIESGAAMLCHVWTLERLDGARAGFTDHDQDLTVDGLACSASTGWTVGVAEAGVGTASGSLAVSGVTGGEASDWDGARVELWRVDWARPDLKVRLWVGTMSRLRREGQNFIAELDGPMAALERVVGRTYGRMCDARFGDGRCGVSAEAWPGAPCDRRWATCVGTFGNGINFQGFPDIPGDDFLTAYPVSGGRHDGRSRR